MVFNFNMNLLQVLKKIRRPKNKNFLFHVCILDYRNGMDSIVRALFFCWMKRMKQG